MRDEPFSPSSEQGRPPVVVVRLTTTTVAELVTEAKEAVGAGADLVIPPSHPAGAEREGGAADPLAVAFARAGIPWLPEPVQRVVPVDTFLAGGSAVDGPDWICDLGSRQDRAELAALVTVAMEAGAAGFLTVAPTAVRRAAHVIRAVQTAR